MEVVWKMRVTTKENGTYVLQIEDWSKNYPGTFPFGNTLAAYPVSKVNIEGAFSPKCGDIFRCEFNFPNHELALDAAETIAFRDGELSWYTQYLRKREYLPCITGKLE